MTKINRGLLPGLFFFLQKLIIGNNYGFIRGQRLATLNELNGKANSSHNHNASNITSGTLSVARGGTGRSTLTSGYFLRGNGTSAVTMSSVDQVKDAIGLATSESPGLMSPSDKQKLELYVPNYTNLLTYNNRSITQYIHIGGTGDGVTRPDWRVYNILNLINDEITNIVWDSYALIKCTLQISGRWECPYQYSSISTHLCGATGITATYPMNSRYYYKQLGTGSYNNSAPLNYDGVLYIKRSSTSAPFQINETGPFDEYTTLDASISNPLSLGFNGYSSANGSGEARMTISISVDVIPK